MSHKSFSLTLLLANLVMSITVLIGEYARQSCMTEPLCCTCPSVSAELDAVLMPLDQVFLPVQVRDMAKREGLACFTDGNHDLLAPRDALVTTQDLYRSAALLDAARGNHHETVRQLLDSGMNLNQMDCFGNTPYSLAKSAGHRELAHLLAIATQR